MEIGEPSRTYTIEPLEDPIPREAPDDPFEEREEEPSHPEEVPA
jgi:hypothetical protein